ncbi:lipopolysaccharide heptosyltransferase I [Vespertiliibacter pulmonis]|uniref:Lipopolysaccharide heptosyltransferase 1 n=1 Tax=Vespertiliibacter pulmonis TaxID=1443036 RepID=A0A3N4VI96_9PAST|nr:lipopolysaccharide heptosyltransferase RfaC [Vespertiliibacter pulmonis]QLB20638.1 lipopolysaccharide heptosyltransferase I [Vespertiliibacter pulmonis]RPE82772.1 heptosyltransferase-1 [Vespertiliibacter pulmonis]
MKICVIKTSSMGDVIHTLPALTDAQNAISNLQVDWVVEPAFAEIPRWHSAVNQVIPFAWREWRKRLFHRETWQAWKAYKQQLQVEKYDAVIDAQGLLKSAMLATHLAQGVKYGYDKKSARERFSTYFYDRAFNIPYQQHAVERIRKLFSMTLGYPLPTTIGDYGLAKNRLDLTACSPYLIAIHATTRADKHWKEHYWLELFHRLALFNIEIRLPWGNLEEFKRATRLAQQCANIRVLPKLTLTELASEIVGAKGVISVDTGLSHLTAALDKVNVVLYGATDPKLIGAYGKHQIYLQADGMDKILPDQVFQAIKKAI